MGALVAFQAVVHAVRSMAGSVLSSAATGLSAEIGQRVGVRQSLRLTSIGIISMNSLITYDILLEYCIPHIMIPVYSNYGMTLCGPIRSSDHV